MAKDTPTEIIAKESRSPLVGYGGMLMESMVAIMALVIGMTIIIKMGKATYTWVTLLLKRGEPRGEEALALLSFHHSLRSQRRKGKC